MPPDHGWRGKGRFRLARLDNQIVLAFSGLHTKGGKLKNEIGDFFRKDYPGQKPNYAPFAVNIWIELHQWQQKIDVDNVAKACLDALTGHIWKDDRQIVSLRVEKVQSEREAITLIIHEADAPLGSRTLTELLATIDQKD